MPPRRMKYNPAFLSEDELVQSFVVREAELKLITDVIRENVHDSNQHVLVIGQRGMGKTMLGLRVVAEVRRDDHLRQSWYPLVFAEESYEVTTPGEFWLEAIFHLWHQTGESRWAQAYKDLKGEQDEARLRDRALGALMDFADEQGKRLLLVVENLNMLLGDQISEDNAWVLRHALQHEPRVMLLASATSHFDETENTGKAMFDIFKLIKLRPLDENECRRVWVSITGHEPTDGRIRPIQILTGGSPRLLTIISSFGAKRSFRELMGDLTQLVDEHTEYFKTHLDNLPPTERKVYLALAELWDPSTAREVSEAARLDVNMTSSLLRRLVSRGAVALVDDGRRTKWYQVAERLYNIYYLMRRRGAPSSRVEAVVNFIIGFYEEEEMADIVCRIIEEARELSPAEREGHYAACELILRNQQPSLRFTLLENLPADLLRDSDIPESLRLLIAEAMEPVPLRAGLLAATLGKTPEQLQKASEALTIVREGLELLDRANDRQEAEQTFLRALEVDPECALAHLGLGVLLSTIGDREDEAQDALERCVAIDEGSWIAWMRLGLLLKDKPGQLDAAEHAFRKAVELAPESADAWATLGLLLVDKLGKHQEAESALRKTIEIAPDRAMAWAVLGKIMVESPDRRDEAEAAFRKAVELNPDMGVGWKNLAVLLSKDAGRADEALLPTRRYLEDTALVREEPLGAVALVAELAAAGVGREALDIISESPSAEFLEPLQVGLKLFLGEDVKAAAEILEVGKDVAARIRKLAEKGQAAESD